MGSFEFKALKGMKVSNALQIKMIPGYFTFRRYFTVHVLITYGFIISMCIFPHLIFKIYLMVQLKNMKHCQLELFASELTFLRSLAERSTGIKLAGVLNPLQVLTT